MNRDEINEVGDDLGLRFHGGTDALSGDAETSGSSRIPSVPNRRLDVIWLPRPKTVIF